MKDTDALIQTLLSDGPPSVNTNQKVAHEIFNLVYAQGCKTVVIENPYVDEDHRRCHAKLHRFAHSAVSRYCKRLHFFAREFANLNELKTISSSDQESYMGMCVWRPTNAYPIGRTIIASKYGIKIPPAGKWIPYLTCAAYYPVNIAGIKFTVYGFPFIQQDHLVTTCATASIWMCQWYMSERYNEIRRYYTPEITDLATAYDLSAGRAIPSEGLTNQQIVMAFRSLGYDPAQHDLVDKTSKQIYRILYNYIESGIPLVASIVTGTSMDHAITVLGHGLEDDCSPTPEAFPNAEKVEWQYIDAADYNTVFIISDDQYGPYRWMKLMDIDKVTGPILSAMFNDASAEAKAKQIIEHLKKERITTLALFGNYNNQELYIAGMSFLVAALPQTVTLGPEDAQDKAIAAFLGSTETKEIPIMVVRTYLIPSNEYKEHIIEVLEKESDLAWWIRSFYYPKWIWVTEFSFDLKATGRKVASSIIIDSSASRDTVDFVLMQKGDWIIPVPHSTNNIVKLIKEIAKEGKELKDATFKPYTQLERELK
ncbi:MAG: hypothetical protein WC566_01120 [Dehalococcoidia bacterium]